tara:strand:- start:48 stop:305 length:258 start_codon:yes stop_codon:yes gene_type:complete
MKYYIYVILLSLSVFTITASSENKEEETSCQSLYLKNNSSLGSYVEKDSSNPYCCKICKKGKACGDSCINKNYTCRKPPGCACNG